MANDNKNPEVPGRVLNLEVPGDTNSADIVDRTGEQMPRQSHDGVTDDNRNVKANDEDVDRARREDPMGTERRHDNPRTGRISDW